MGSQLFAKSFRANAELLSQKTTKKSLYNFHGSAEALFVLIHYEWEEYDGHESIGKTTISVVSSPPLDAAAQEYAHS